MTGERDHGGGLDEAVARFGGERSDWLDLSTGINPIAYPVGDLPSGVWSELPDKHAQEALATAARKFWGVPEAAQIVAAPGLSSVIARIPQLVRGNTATVAGPTYNEYAATLETNCWTLDAEAQPDLRVFVHPNNPDGRLHDKTQVVRDHPGLTIVDESFCDTDPGQSFVPETDRPGLLVLKSFGKFWGLAGLRLGFAIGHTETLSATPTRDLAAGLGPWPVSGPALEIGRRALSDTLWAEKTRRRLMSDTARIDRLLSDAGGKVVGGTTLFRLCQTDDARRWQDHLARQRIWTRIFPYSDKWVRFGLPDPGGWDRLESALGDLP